MKYLSVSVLVAALALAAACQRTTHRDIDAHIGEVSVTDLAALTEQRDCLVLDANGAEYRKLHGVIPGARLLSSYKAYPFTELPEQTTAKLVFYCVDETCGNSVVAARRAVRAGYTNVHILPAGIAGWKSGGQPVRSL